MPRLAALRRPRSRARPRRPRGPRRTTRATTPRHTWRGPRPRRRLLGRASGPRLRSNTQGGSLRRRSTGSSPRLLARAAGPPPAGTHGHPASHLSREERPSVHRTLRFQLIAIVVATVASVLAMSQWLDTTFSARALERDRKEHALPVLSTVDSLWGRSAPEA